MQRQSFSAFVPAARARQAALFSLIFLFAGVATAAPPPGPAAPSTVDAATRLQLLPLAFERNDGQADPRAKYVARGAGYSLMLLPGQTVLNVGRKDSLEQIRLKFAGADAAAQAAGQDRLPTIVNYIIGNDRSRWHTNIATFGKVTYRRLYPGIDLLFYGNQGRLEHDFVVAPGADPRRIAMVVAGAQKVSVNARGDLILSTRSGELQFLKPVAYQLIAGHRREVASRFQLRNGNRVGFEIGKYDRASELIIDPVLNWNTYLFGTTTDTTTTRAVAVDSSSGTLYLAGQTTAASFGSTSPATCATCAPSSGQKAFIARIDKLDVSSNATLGSKLKWLTYIGGSGNETVNTIALDGTNVYVGGQTTSTNTGAGSNGDLPVTSPTFETTGTVKNATSAGFVLGVGQTAGNSLAYGSYVGENSGNSAVTGVVINGGSDIASGAHIFAAGWTDNGGGLLTNAEGYQQTIHGSPSGFLVELITSKNGTADFNSGTPGALVYGTYIQTKNATAGDSMKVNGLALDTAAYPNWVKSTSYNQGDRILPTNNNAGNFVYEADSAGTANTSNSSEPAFPQTVGGTVQDGTGGTKFNWINIGKVSGNVYLAGSATGFIPTKGSSCPNGTAITATEGFVLRLDISSGGCGALDNSSNGYIVGLGSTGTTSVNAIAIDSSTPVNAYVTGSTTSSGMKSGSTVTNLTASALGDSAACSGCGDAFVARVVPTGVSWSAYLGGDNFDVGNAIAVDSNNNVALVGTTSTPQSGATNAFPLVNAPATAPFNALPGNQAAFLSIITSANTSSPALSYSSYYGGNQAERGNAVALLQNVATPTPPAVIAYFGGSTVSQNLPTNAVAAQAGPASAFGTGATKAISSIGVTSNVATVTATAHGFAVGQYVSISGATDTTLDGTCQVASTTTNTFTCPFIHANLTAALPAGTPVVGASNTGGFAARLSFVNAPAALTLTGSSDVPSLGFNTAAGYASTINYTFTINVSSGSPSNVAFDASIPTVTGSPAFNITSVTPDSGTCQVVAAKGVTCLIDSATNGTKVKVTGTATSAVECNTATPCTSIPVTFNASVAAAETGTTNATAGVSAPGVPVTDIQLTNAGSPASVAVGGTDTITYTLVVTNAGPNDVNGANKLTVDDTLPADFVIDLPGSTLDAAWTCNTSTPGHLICQNNASFAHAATATFTIKGNYLNSAVLAGGSAPRINHATVTVDQTAALDNNTVNNTPADVTTTVTRTADLQVTSYTDNTQTTASDLSGTVTFAVGVKNAGPSDANGVQVAFVITAGSSNYTLGTNDFPGGSCVKSTLTITCTVSGTMAASATATYHVSITPDPAWVASGVQTGTISSQATISSANVLDDGTAGAPGANNTSTALTTNLQRQSDLQMVSLSDNSQTTPVSLAGPLTLTASVKNAGPDDATGVVVHFTLTDGGNNAYTLGTNSFPSGCAAATNVITCTVGTLTNGTTGTYSVQVTPDPAWVSATSNVGTISTVADTSSPGVVDDGAAGAPGANNTSSSLTDHLARTSDLQIASYIDNSQTTPVSESGTLTLTANLKNAGPDAAIDAVVTFTLTAGSSSYTMGTNTFPSGCVNAALTITCTVGPIAKNATPSYSVNLTPDPAWVGAATKTGTITSVAQISSPHVYDDGASGAAGANNSSTTLTTNISRQADLRTTVVTDNSGVTPVNLTGTLVISSTIANFGPDAANGNIVVQVTFPGSNYTINNGLTTFNGGCVKDGTTPTIADCTVNGSLASGANVSYNLAVTPDPAWLSTTSATGTINPSVKVSSTSVYDDGASGAPGANNTNATLTTHLERLADLQLTALTDNSTINPVPLAAPPVGTGLKYITSIKNAGPDTAESVKVVYTLPTAAYTFSSTTLGTCVQATTTLTCTIGQLTTAAGTVSFTVTVAPDPAAIPTTANPPTASVSTSGQVQSSAVVDDGTAGAPGANNNGSVNSALERQSDLRIGTMTDNSPVSLAGTLTMTTPIQNLGPDTAPNVTVSFTLPSSAYTYTTNSGFATCGQAGAIVTCSLASLARNVSTPTNTSISVTPDPAAVPANAPSVTATINAQISSLNTVDNNNVNDTGSDVATIARKSDLQITSLTDNTSSTNPVSLAGTLTYTVNVKNAGPDDATGVQVAFTLPTAGFTYLTNTGFGSCAQASAVITCQIAGTVANGATPSFSLSVTPDPASVTTSVPPTVVSTSATVSSAVVVDNGTSGVPGANNTATRNSAIARRSDLEFISLTDNSTATNPVPLGGPLTFATQIKNFGPDDAIGVVVKYTVPSGFTYSTSTGYTGCSQTSTLITCTVGGAVTNGSSPSFSMTVVPGASAIPTTVKSATAGMSAVVSSTQVFDDGTSGNPNPANNDGADTANLARRSDLQVISFTDNSPVGDAGPLILTAKIQNVNTAGFGDDAVSVDVVFTLANSNFTAVGSSGFSSCSPQSGATVTCHYGALTVAAGAVNVSLSVTPQSLASGGPVNPVTNVQVQSADVWDDTPNTGAPSANNDGQVTSSIQSVVHLSFTHTSSPAVGTFANLAQTVKYTIDIHNATTTTGGAATSAAQGVMVTENLPSTFISRAVDASSTAGWSCNFAASPVSCTLSGLINPGSTSANDAILVISGVYTDDPTLMQLPGGGPYSPGTGNSGNITATLSTTSTDPDGFSPINTSTDLRRLVALGATAASNPAAGSGTLARLGTDVVYTIVVSNPSTVALPTDTATAVYVDVTIPANFIGVAIDPTSTAGWSCVPANFSTSPVRCTQANPLPPNTTQTLVLRGQYSDTTTQSVLTNGLGTAGISVTPGVTASVQAASVPIVPAVANTDIQRLIHLTATATSSPAAGVAFANLQTPVTYTFNVSNAATVNSVATDSAAGVVLYVTLPSTFINPAVTSANWDCAGFAANPAPCSFNGSIPSGGTAATPLVITGEYSNATAVLPGGGAYAPGTGNVSVNANLTATLSQDPTPGSVATSTDIRRDVQLTITQAQPTANPVSLGAAESYTVRVSNTPGSNDAAGVVVADTLPSGFNLTSASGTGWSCGGNVSGVVTCTVTGTIAGGATSNDLVISGSYDKTISLAGTGTGTRTNSAAVSATLSFDEPGTAKSASIDTTIQRNVNLGISMSAAPNPIGAGGAASNVVTYTVNVNNTGVDPASGSPTSIKVDFTAPLPSNFTNVTASGSGTSTVTCDTTTNYPHVICTYPSQDTTPTVITIKGQFDQTTVASTGSALAQASVAVSTADAIDTDANNNAASSTVTVVDTPAGTNIVPLLGTSGHPITVTYSTVTQAGITTQAVTQVPPTGFHEPAIDYPTVDYSTALPNYFVVASDPAAPVAFNTPTAVCVAYTTLAGVTFTKPERVRFFDATGKDITSYLDAANVCGRTANPGPNLGAFTVREPRNHAPVAKAAAQQLFSGKIGTNQFTLDASGTTDADIQQICNGSPTPPAAGSQFCGDTLTYTWTGPPGMNASNGSNTFTQVVKANADGTLGAPSQVTGSFPLGISTVTLTVTDQTGATSTSQVSVSVNSFTLSTTNQSAIISPGQSTSFQVIPQDANKQPLQFTGNMTLTCTGFKNSDNSSLAANHITCSVSPNSIPQGQFSTALIVTVGPNFSKANPVRPGSRSGGALAMFLALMSPALMGIVVLPGRSRRWKTLLILALLLVGLGLQLGCGGTGNTPTAQTIPVTTPAGTYTITITGTAAGGVTSTNTFTLTVQ